MAGLRSRWTTPFSWNSTTAGEQRQRDLDGARASAIPLLAGDELLERLALDELHDQKRNPVGRADIEDVDHVRMANLRRDPHLGQEALGGALGVRRPDGMHVKDLERHPAAKRPVDGLVDRASTAAGDRPHDSYRSIALPGQRTTGGIRGLWPEPAAPIRISSC